MKKETIIYYLNHNRKFIESRGAFKIGLFGSFAKNSQTASSDIDLFVHLDDKYKTFDNFSELAFFLEDLFGSKVDLITPESIGIDFYNSIKNDIIYAY